MKKRFIWIIILLIGCKNINGQQEMEQEIVEKIMNCVNENVNQNLSMINGKPQFNFYDFVVSIENYLIDEKLLSDNSQQDYSDLFVKILELNNLEGYQKYVGVLDIADRFGYEVGYYKNNEAIFNLCPYQGAKIELKLAKGVFFKHGSRLNNIMKEGFKNKDVILEYLYGLDEKEFEKIVFRAPLIINILNILNDLRDI